VWVCANVCVWYSFFFLHSACCSPDWVTSLVCVCVCVCVCVFVGLFLLVCCSLFIPDGSSFLPTSRSLILFPAFTGTVSVVDNDPLSLLSSSSSSSFLLRLSLCLCSAYGCCSITLAYILLHTHTQTHTHIHTYTHTLPLSLSLSLSNTAKITESW
jgi:hypothetical protein